MPGRDGYSLWLGPALSPAVAREADVERVRHLTRHQPLAAAVNLIYAAIVAAYFWDVSPPGLLLGWLAAVGAVSAVQLPIWLRNRRRPRPVQVSRRSLLRAVAWAAVAAALWSGFAVLQFPAESPPHQVLIAFVLGGLAAGSIPILHCLPAAQFAHLAVLSLPLLAYVTATGSADQHWMASLVVVFFAALGIAAVNAYRVFVSGVALKVRNAELTAQSEASSRAKSLFLANMSHELRTPLNAVIGFSDIIRDEIFGPIGSPRYRQYADDINRSGVHLLGIINDILDLSKVEAGQMALNERTVPIPEVVETAVTIVRPRAEQDDVRIAVDLDPALPPIRADALKLSQVLVNVLTNAVKVSPEGAPVHVAAWRREDGRIAIAVEDEGPGIRPEDVDKALTPFVQLAAGAAAGGTGLGLPLARMLTELHGGALTIGAGEGRGTRVSILLPAARAVDAAAAA